MNHHESCSACSEACQCEEIEQLKEQLKEALNLRTVALDAAVEFHAKIFYGICLADVVMENERLTNKLEEAENDNKALRDKLKESIQVIREWLLVSDIINKEADNNEQ